MPSGMLVAADDPRLRWSGAVSLEPTAGGLKPWRIPHEDRDLYHPELVIRAEMPAGVRVSFVSDADTLRVLLNPEAERAKIDLVVDGRLVGSEDTVNRAEVSFGQVGSGTKHFELWLPQFGPFELKGIKLSDGASLQSDEPDNQEKRWITYGSSITQCRAANSPTLTWPAIVARQRRYDLTCLGFGGQCHLDPLVATVVRDSDADLISLCLGINIYGAGSLNERTFAPGILGFVRIIREKHPETPLVLMSPIYSCDREQTLNSAGFSLVAMRSEVERAARLMQDRGDGNIHYVDGLDVLGEAQAAYLEDELHPNSEGYGFMARNLLNLLPIV